MATIPQHTSNSIHRTMKMEASSKHNRIMNNVEASSKRKHDYRSMDGNHSRTRRKTCSRVGWNNEKRLAALLCSVQEKEFGYILEKRAHLKWSEESIGFRCSSDQGRRQASQEIAEKNFQEELEKARSEIYQMIRDSAKFTWLDFAKRILYKNGE